MQHHLVDVLTFVILLPLVKFICRLDTSNVFSSLLFAGGSAKTLLIVNICPNASNLSETLSSLSFSARARNAILSLGNRDTIKKWRDIVSVDLSTVDTPTGLWWMIQVLVHLFAVAMLFYFDIDVSYVVTFRN